MREKRDNAFVEKSINLIIRVNRFYDCPCNDGHNDYYQGCLGEIKGEGERGRGR